MKEDVLNAIATFATLADLATWTWIAAALFATSCGAWLVIAIVRSTASAIRRANRTINAARADLITHHELDAHLDAYWQQYTDETRKEEQP